MDDHGYHNLAFNQETMVVTMRPPLILILRQSLSQCDIGTWFTMDNFHIEMIFVAM